ncbi:MAG: winged helix-turn-helix domain-containing protein [Bifidobacteriaceae bacterium]|jgi:DNA-binding response OmpR family regulator|nr:winged helix-turn-helix domain-containing protein [Bifidobacteriaceae bacterium]
MVKINQDELIFDTSRGQLILNKMESDVSHDNSSIYLTPSEFEILYLLLENKSELISKQEICCRALLYQSDLNTRTVDTHLYNIKKKLKLINPDLDKFIRCYPGRGYRID